MRTLIYGCGRTGEAIASRLDGEVHRFRGEKSDYDDPLHLFESLESFDRIVVTLANGGPDFSLDSTWDMRDSELEKNLLGIVDFGCLLYSSSFDGVVDVVSNPSDVFARYLRESFQLDTYSFGLSLDEFRYSDYLGYDVDAIGFHGASVPLIGSSNESDYANLINAVEDQVMQGVRRRGINYSVVGRIFETWNPESFIREDVNCIESKLHSQNIERFNEQYALLCNKL